MQYSPMDINNKATMWFSDAAVDEVMNEEDTAMGVKSAYLAIVNGEDADESATVDEDDDVSVTNTAHSPISTSDSPGEADSDLEGGRVDSAKTTAVVSITVSGLDLRLWETILTRQCTHATKHWSARHNLCTVFIHMP